jgi:hypothetical protein
MEDAIVLLLVCMGLFFIAIVGPECGQNHEFSCMQACEAANGTYQVKAGKYGCWCLDKESNSFRIPSD